jgi:hypothetical protein
MSNLSEFVSFVNSLTCYTKLVHGKISLYFIKRSSTVFTEYLLLVKKKDKTIEKKIVKPVCQTDTYVKINYVFNNLSVTNDIEILLQPLEVFNKEKSDLCLLDLDKSIFSKFLINDQESSFNRLFTSKDILTFVFDYSKIPKGKFMFDNVPLLYNNKLEEVTFFNILQAKKPISFYSTCVVEHNRVHLSLSKKDELMKMYNENIYEFFIGTPSVYKQIQIISFDISFCTINLRLNDKSENSSVFAMYKRISELSTNVNYKETVIPNNVLKNIYYVFPNQNEDFRFLEYKDSKSIRIPLSQTSTGISLAVKKIGSEIGQEYIEEVESKFTLKCLYFKNVYNKLVFFHNSFNKHLTEVFNIRLNNQGLHTLLLSPLIIESAKNKIKAQVHDSLYEIIDGDVYLLENKIARFKPHDKFGTKFTKETNLLCRSVKLKENLRSSKTKDVSLCESLNTSLENSVLSTTISNLLDSEMIIFDSYFYVGQERLEVVNRKNERVLLYSNNKEIYYVYCALTNKIFRLIEVKNSSEYFEFEEEEFYWYKDISSNSSLSDNYFFDNYLFYDNHLFSLNTLQEVKILVNDKLKNVTEEYLELCLKNFTNNASSNNNCNNVSNTDVNDFISNSLEPLVFTEKKLVIANYKVLFDGQEFEFLSVPFPIEKYSCTALFVHASEDEYIILFTYSDHVYILDLPSNEYKKIEKNTLYCWNSAVFIDGKAFTLERHEAKLLKNEMCESVQINFENNKNKVSTNYVIKKTNLNSTYEITKENDLVKFPSILDVNLSKPTMCTINPSGQIESGTQTLLCDSWIPNSLSNTKNKYILQFADNYYNTSSTHLKLTSDFELDLGNNKYIPVSLKSFTPIGLHLAKVMYSLKDKCHISVDEIQLQKISKKVKANKFVKIQVTFQTQANNKVCDKVYDFTKDNIIFDESSYMYLIVNENTILVISKSFDVYFFDNFQKIPQITIFF